MSKSQEVDESSPSDQVNASQTSHEPRPHPTSYLVFFFMQAALTVLSWYCYVHPRQLPWFDTDDEHTTIRSGINSLFSWWQSAAALPAQNIYSAVSSMEEKAVRNDLNCLDAIMHWSRKPGLSPDGNSRQSRLTTVNRHYDNF